MLDGLGLGESSVLIVIGDANPHLEISARNLPRVGVIRVAGLNVYDVLRHEKLLIDRAALEALGARLGAEGGAA
jgi:large subunit ribosomal protein L4